MGWGLLGDSTESYRFSNLEELGALLKLDLGQKKMIRGLTKSAGHVATWGVVMISTLGFVM